jgi:hypothetical protein
MLLSFWWETQAEFPTARDEPSVLSGEPPAGCGKSGACDADSE